MTLSTNQTGFFKPTDITLDEFNSVDVSTSEDGLWSIMGTPVHNLDENGLNPISQAGAIFIYKKVEGLMVQKQKIVAQVRGIDYHFGSRVWMAAYGRRFFVASREDSITANNSGAVFVYDLNETTGVWSFKERIEPAGGSLVDSKFGWSMVSDFYGQLLVVGAPFEANGGTLRGAGYLFRDENSIFVQKNKFSYSKSVDNSMAGYSIAISGDGNVIFLGMTLSDLSGIVGVFKKNLAGNFPSIENSLLKDPDSLPNDYFSVAIEDLNTITGKALVVDHEGRNVYMGASGKQDPSVTTTGVVFRFIGDRDYNYTLKDVIVQRKGKTSDIETLTSKFGYSLSTDRRGTTLLVGAKDDNESATGSGAAYLYKGDISFDTYALKIKADTPVSNEHKANSVAISYDGSTGLLGASGIGTISTP